MLCSDAEKQLHHIKASFPVLVLRPCVSGLQQRHSAALLPPLFTAGCGFHLLFFLRPLARPAFPALTEGGFTGRAALLSRCSAAAAVCELNSLSLENPQLTRFTAGGSVQLLC